MNKVKITTLSDRCRNAINAFKGRPIGSVCFGVNITKCDECEYKQTFDFLDSTVSYDTIYQGMIAITEEYYDDREVRHEKMDKLMVRLLRALGYEKAMDVFEGTSKWYG